MNPPAEDHSIDTYSISVTSLTPGWNTFDNASVSTNGSAPVSHEFDKLTGGVMYQIVAYSFSGGVSSLEGSNTTCRTGKIV